MRTEIDQPGRDASAPGPELRGAGQTQARDPEHGTIEEPALPNPAPDPASPAIYTAVDRPRGLNAYFAPGGEDEATDERRADERRNLRLLLLMVAALVLIPTLLTVIAFAQELVAHRGG